MFIGKVVSVEDPGLPTDDRLTFKVIDLVRPIKVRLAIEHMYRGHETKEMVIATQTGGLEFGHEFKVGDKYLVYALANGDEKSELVVKGCGRTRLVEEAKDDITILEATMQ